MAAESNSHEKVRRHGKIHELPSDLRKEVDALLIEPGTTYEDAVAFVKGKGHDISKSAMGRYGKDFLARYQRLRIIEDQSRALISDVGDGLILDEAGGKLMAQKMIELLMKENGVKDKDLPYFADGLSRIIRANVSREKLKSDLQEKIAKMVNKTAGDVEKIVKRHGISAATAEDIKNKILHGIKV